MSLNDTCTICHQGSKYKCPRCGARTCSLSCNKTHKARSLCNGVRNPGAYLKRKELATEKTFDQDFNFIAGLERQLESSSRDLDRREISLQDEHRSGPRKGETQTKHILDENEIMVRRAPPVMERHRTNKTCWHPKSKSIMWTVEWILQTGERELGTIKDTKPLPLLFQLYQEAPATPAKKEPKTATGSNRDDRPHPPDAADQEEATDQGTLDIKDSKFFLLHVPGESRGNAKTVILLDSTKPLREALRGNEVLEYPTIEVTSTIPKDLDPSIYAVYNSRLDLGRRDCMINDTTVSVKRPAEPEEADEDVKLAKTIAV